MSRSLGVTEDARLRFTKGSSAGSEIENRSVAWSRCRDLLLLRLRGGSCSCISFAIVSAASRRLLSKIAAWLTYRILSNIRWKGAALAPDLQRLVRAVANNVCLRQSKSGSLFGLSAACMERARQAKCTRVLGRSTMKMRSGFAQYGFRQSPLICVNSGTVLWKVNLRLQTVESSLPFSKRCTM